MNYYEINFFYDDEEYHLILTNEKEYSKKEFWKMCNKFFHMFPKRKEYRIHCGKEYVWYSYSEYECLDYIADKLCDEYGFELIEVDVDKQYVLGEEL